MKIALIQPKMTKRPMDTDLKTRMSPPLALLTLAGLTPAGHEVVMFNENAGKIAYDADLAGITVTLDVMPRAIQIAKRFQSMGIPVVAGGIHVTCRPDECLPHFDAVCVGAAERVWARIIGDAQRKNLKKVYHDMEGFRGAELASPAYGALDKARYLYTNVVTTSRGCPNRCGFCYNSCENRVYVCRPVSDVLKDIAALKTRHILFVDDNFIGTPGYTRELLTHLDGMGLKWGAAVTAQILEHPDLLDLMARTGCQSLFIGFESINNASLRDVHKDNRFEQYERLVSEIHRRSIMVNASMVFGLDGDGPDVFRRTVDWLVKNKVETLTSHILTPYPGTELYRRMDAEGRIADRDLSRYNTAHVVFKPKGMPPEKLYAGYLWVYREFYAFKNILRRMPEHRAQRKSYIMFNLFYRKFGKFSSALAKVLPMRVLGRLGAWLSYRIK